jgi:hypothetical protein
MTKSSDHGKPRHAAADAAQERRETRRTWLWLTVLTVGTLIWGFLLYFTVGDKGPPPWDFGAVDDLPGGSPYSTYGPLQFPGTAPHPIVAGPEVDPQHVRARPGAGGLQP